MEYSILHGVMTPIVQQADFYFRGLSFMDMTLITLRSVHLYSTVIKDTCLYLLIDVIESVMVLLLYVIKL